MGGIFVEKSKVSPLDNSAANTMPNATTPDAPKNNTPETTASQQTPAACITASPPAQPHILKADIAQSVPDPTKTNTPDGNVSPNICPAIPASSTPAQQGLGTYSGSNTQSGLTAPAVTIQTATGSPPPQVPSLPKCDTKAADTSTSPTGQPPKLVTTAPQALAKTIIAVQNDGPVSSTNVKPIQPPSINPALSVRSASLDPLLKMQKV